MKKIHRAEDEITLCGSAPKALQYLHDHHDRPTQLPDLILLDLEKTGTDTIESQQAIRHEKPIAWIPIVFLSNANEPEDVKSVYNAGANAYV